MERIQAAIQKAKERRGEGSGPLPPPLGAGALRPGRAARRLPGPPGPSSRTSSPTRG